MTASLPDAATLLTVLRGGPIGSSRTAWRLIPLLAILSIIISMPLRFSPSAFAQEAGTVITLPDLPFVLPVPLTDDEWPHFRQNIARTGAQRYASNLSDPRKVGGLSVRWSFPASGPPAAAFRTSPVVFNNIVFIGSEGGIFYALDAATGQLKWQYPGASDPPLLGSDPRWQHGFLSSAAYWDHRRAQPGAASGLSRDAVIFGAQDPSLGPVGSDARLFALDPETGAVIWKSDSVATFDGFTPSSLNELRSLTELHQRIAFSPPLIFNNKIYVGIHDTRDDPIQTGLVVAVRLSDGRVDTTFRFRAVGTPASARTVRGGGVWNALATDGTGVYLTTGNTRIPWCVYPYTLDKCPLEHQPEPTPNFGLSMIRADKDTGAVAWAFNVIPFARDGDPDWAAGATVMSTSCGQLIASVQKDGWSYAVNARDGAMRWQFPPTIARIGESAFRDLVHGDDDYRRPGAAWDDVFIVRTGGEASVPVGHVSDGYKKLHALNVCAESESDRVRWIADIPNEERGHASVSAPTVTGGIVFIGTNEDPDPDPAHHGKGHLIVLGDPSVVPPAGWRCSNVDFWARICPSPYVLVPIPRQLARIAMPDGGSLAAIRNEPVLARGRVFVATSAGHVYMLAP